MGISSQLWRTYTAKAENRKGKSRTDSKLMIDMEPNAAPRIREEKESLVKVKMQPPERSPRRKEHASRNMDSLQPHAGILWRKNKSMSANLLQNWRINTFEALQVRLCMAQASISPLSLIHPYYTPKSIEFQAYFAFLTIFVNYAQFLCQHRYVNYCNFSPHMFIIFNFLPRYWDWRIPLILNIVFARKLAKTIL